MRLIASAFLCLILAGCASTPQFITKEKLTVIEPDNSLYSCPSAGKYPNPETLTDVQVAKLLLSYERANAECRRNMNAIKMFIENAKQRANQTAN